MSLDQPQPKPKPRIKLPTAATFEEVYRRADGLRFERTVEGADLGRCEGCLKVVRVNPPEEADTHACERWWDAPIDYSRI